MKELTKAKTTKSAAKIPTVAKPRRQTAVRTSTGRNGKTVETSAECNIRNESIASRAYTLWEQAGRPEGCDLQFWLQAESQLKHGSG